MLASRPMKRSPTALAVVLATLVGSWSPRALAAPNRWPTERARVRDAAASSDANDRRAAIGALSGLPREEALALAVVAMRDPEPAVRLDAARFAARFGAESASAIALTWLTEPDARARLVACDVLAASPIGAAVTPLARVLSDPSAEVRRAAVRALSRAEGRESTASLLSHLDDPVPEVRVEVVTALARLGQPEAVLALSGKLQDTAPEVRRAVAVALGMLGDARAVPSLILALADGALDVRLAVAGALGRLRHDDATGALLAVLREVAPVGAVGPSSEAAVAMRGAVLRALARIGTPRAIEAVVDSLELDRVEAQRLAAREALEDAGPAIAPALERALASATTRPRAAGIAAALGAVGTPSHAEAILVAMQRGLVRDEDGWPAIVALRLDGVLRDRAIQGALERLPSASSGVRAAAAAALGALLDPARVDGRAVEPLLEALGRDTGELRPALLRALGRTGSPRALPALQSAAQSGPILARRAAIEALGDLGGAASSAVDGLLTTIDREDALRLDAATALARVGDAGAVARLLERLLTAAEVDRTSLGIALSGVLQRTTDAAVIARVAAALESASPSVRDALLEGLGRSGSPAALEVLGRLISGSVDDRRKVAEALAGHAASARSRLVALARDPDATVRANVAWALASADPGADSAASAALLALASDPDHDVAANAIASIGRVALASDSGQRCKALVDRRAYVRANAARAASDLGASCPLVDVARLLERDPSEIVRLNAAESVRRLGERARAAGDVSGSKLAARALERCRDDDPSRLVAARCSDRPGRLAATSIATDVTIAIVPDRADAPTPRAAFALQRPDGYLRLGVADRRGIVFERGLPEGELELRTPSVFVALER
jgi:HEAT repeat protein